ncbi:hypothetical protein BDP55DRAFT_655415 [Colletotrichum godetiae]|uniref:Secreted protein n=1 Tax=Colletotrichum godetiae TaxID=1209918 RepID=A0AAJ0AR49_9PEZI|nr:uncharacterized protein BDP55DRAFT_655415 [Colletotrichum godetiae]KAK1688845.1 hypothetical protein BDP55DRAFT_655415 [Colletotrichum godetiae]
MQLSISLPYLCLVMWCLPFPLLPCSFLIDKFSDSPSSSAAGSEWFQVAFHLERRNGLLVNNTSGCRQNADRLQ